MSQVDAEELRRSLRRAAVLFDPPTPGLLATATAAHALRVPGAELAEVMFDSRVAPPPVRGDTDVRLLTFEATTVTVDVEVTRGVTGNALVGQLTPARPAELVVRGRQPMTARADHLGRFGYEHLPRGPFSLLIRLLGDPVPLTTDWVVL